MPTSIRCIFWVAKIFHLWQYNIRPYQIIKPNWNSVTVMIKVSRYNIQVRFRLLGLLRAGNLVFIGITDQSSSCSYLVNYNDTSQSKWNITTPVNFLHKHDSGWKNSSLNLSSFREKVHSSFPCQSSIL